MYVYLLSLMSNGYISNQLSAKNFKFNQLCIQVHRGQQSLVNALLAVTSTSAVLVKQHSPNSLASTEGQECLPQAPKSHAQDRSLPI